MLLADLAGMYMEKIHGHLCILLINEIFRPKRLKMDYLCNTTYESDNCVEVPKTNIQVF